MAEDNEEEMYFFIADISGYTSFMVKNQMDHTHGILIISALMKSLIRLVHLPMEISKLEGDAIFLFLRKKKLSKEFKNNPTLLGQQMLRFFYVFSEKLKKLENSTECTCGGCSNIHELTLKIIAHYGKATLSKIGSFRELSGVDVILIHRLLKNRIKERCYFLMTEPAYNRLFLPSKTSVVKAEEEDKDLGKIPVYVYSPTIHTVLQEKVHLSFFSRTKSHFQLALGTTLIKLGLKKPLPFHNLPPV
ncbi:MAG: DUF2652 domain-containing protein [Simkania sp.]|nr:DUF2652 domain-containing protein [Simkania sp.]